MREDNIKDYCNGVCSYLVFLEEVISGTKLYGDYIIKNNDNKFINAAFMGFISNIFLIIKEGIIEKSDNSYNSLILEEILEKNVNMIASSHNGKYMIDGYLFKDKETLMIELRNKIAHGNFVFELEHNRIILKVDNNDIKINIYKLASFIMSSLNSYLKNYKTNEFSRKMTVNNRVPANRNKPITNKNQLIGFIKRYRQKVVTIKSKDGSNIPLNILKDFDRLVNGYESKYYDEKELYNIKNHFKNLYGDRYEIIHENKPYKNVDYDTFATYFLNIMSENSTMYEQSIMLAKELERNENIENKKLNLLIDNLNNLIILDTIKDYKTVNINIIEQKVCEKYGKFYISSYTLGSSVIALFNSLFSYSIDNLFKNDNKYTEFDNNGFDYSKLNFSDFNIELCDIDTRYIDDLKVKKDSKYNELNKINENINKMISNIEKINIDKIDVINKLKEKLNIMNDDKNRITNEYNKLLIEYSNAYAYCNNNKDYLISERIIDGIRNSIAHGNYYIKNNINIYNSIIVFEDIYNNQLTFKCNIKMCDFINFLDSNANIVFDFIENNKIKKLAK